MSYQVIARKWRPQTFEEVTGQETITQTLRNALEHDRLHHAFIFSGSRGVGKTTTARILAKALNCHKTTDKPNLMPCSTNDADACPSCIEISEGRSIDVIEIDAASHTGIDDVRDTILDSINFSPARDRYKVFIVDEVHMLSRNAFNAMLKTLEEPPPRVIFILATTELHKVPETITSRSQEFEFRTISLQKIFDRLRLIADAEGVKVTDEALREIARSGEGSMRDAQSNFDQVISFSGEQIEVEDVTKALGFASVEVLKGTVNAIAGNDVKTIFTTVDDLIARGHDLRNFCKDLLGLTRDLLVYKVAGGDEKLTESARLRPEELAELAAHFSPSDLTRFFNSLAATETQLREASHSRHTLEIGLVKLAEMRRLADLEELINKLGSMTGGDVAVAEKKTLIEPKLAVAEPISPPIPVPEPVIEAEKPEPEPLKELVAEPEIDAPEEPPYFDDQPSDLDEPIDHFEPPFEYAPPPSYASASLSLATLTSEELEHFDVGPLDERYEELLKRAGDDLLPLKSASSLVEAFTSPEKVRRMAFQASNGAATAAVPARDMSHLIPDLKSSDNVGEVPVLSDSPTEEEVRAFAEAHPTIRMAKRIFRAEIASATHSRSGT
ncbi:MAG: DNA polymerase III subunit gamma/tau [Blastocatellia bacterium]|nr:DNA polymerase III subunit gamma/tau [Blastocatellia bacterium]